MKFIGTGMAQAIVSASLIATVACRCDEVTPAMVAEYDSPEQLIRELMVEMGVEEEILRGLDELCKVHPAKFVYITTMIVATSILSDATYEDTAANLIDNKRITEEFCSENTIELARKIAPLFGCEAK